MQENSKYLAEDEIDLKELFKMIWNKRVFILIFTFIGDFYSFFICFAKKPNSNL